jgi:hypothetical protein
LTLCSLPGTQHYRLFYRLFYWLFYSIGYFIELNPGPFQNNEPTLTNNLSPNCNTTSSTMNNNLHTANSSVTTNMYKDLPLPFKGLNFCHLNVQSLTNKLDEIKLILSNRISSSKSIKSNLILGLSETFLDNLWDNAI